MRTLFRYGRFLAIARNDKVLQVWTDKRKALGLTKEYMSLKRLVNRLQHILQRVVAGQAFHDAHRR